MRAKAIFMTAITALWVSTAHAGFVPLEPTHELATKPCPAAHKAHERSKIAKGKRSGSHPSACSIPSWLFTDGLDTEQHLARITDVPLHHINMHAPLSGIPQTYLSTSQAAPENVPEPGTLSLLGISIVGLLFASRRRPRRS